MISKLACMGAVALFFFIPGTARATTINLIDRDNSVAGSPAEEAFRVAAAFWSAQLTNEAVINIEIGYVRLPSLAIGTTSNRPVRVSVNRWARAIHRSRSHSTIDRVLILPDVRHSGIQGRATGIDASGHTDSQIGSMLDGKQTSSRYLMINTPLMKALHLTGRNARAVDATVILNRGFAFDFDPTDGIGPSGVDMVAVAIHEFGHVLGFGSGLDILDEAAGSSHATNAGSSIDPNEQPMFTALDMFRYGGPAMLELRPGKEAFFSVDGGKSALHDRKFSTGKFTGDGSQASHWKDIGRNCTLSFGIMDPGSCGGVPGVVTGADMAALDAIGWNLRIDPENFVSLSTREIVTTYRATQVRTAARP